MSDSPSKTPAQTFFDNLGNEMKDYWDKFGTVLKQSMTDVQQITVETEDLSNTLLYRTIIALDGSVSNQFQVAKPDGNDEYWKRHCATVDQALQNRTAMMLKVIEVVGGVFKLPF